MALPIPIATLERQSVQDLPDARKEEGAADFWHGYGRPRGFILPSWGTRERERQLRQLYRHEYNWLGQSAITGLNKKVASTQWEIKGKKNVRYFQDVLRNAHFGAGWGHFVKLVLLDYFRQDGGAYIEIIAPGSPLKAPTGKVAGIAHLDSLRCFPTGDPEYPVVYYSRKGKKHLMHHTRVIHMVDAPDGDESNPGYGLCAMSRAVSIVARQIHMGRYVEAKLDDKPAPAFVKMSGITRDQRQAAFNAYEMEQSADERPVWGRRVYFHSLDPSHIIDIEEIPFAQSPENWNFIDYNSLDVNAWAAALGTDVQEIWQLTGGNLGSGEQSEVLHAKSQGKTFGDVLTMLERGINDVLPETLEMGFKRRDPYDEQQRAASASAWSGFTASIGDIATADERRRILANEVEPFKDVVTDENGELIRLQDNDPEAESETVVDDTAPTPQVTATETQEAPSVRDAEKAISDTRADFEREFNALLSEARGDETNRRSFSIRLRNLLRIYGEKAYSDGLVDGGASPTLSAEDRILYVRMLAAQSSYVTNLGATLFTDGVSDAIAGRKADLWYINSIRPFYYAGIESADDATLMVWRLGIAEHCKDCPKLDGQVHSLKEWRLHNLWPCSGVTECNIACQCSLTPTKQAKQGNYLL